MPEPVDVSVFAPVAVLSAPVVVIVFAPVAALVASVFASVATLEVKPGSFEAVVPATFPAVAPTPAALPVPVALPAVAPAPVEPFRADVTAVLG